MAKRITRVLAPLLGALLVVSAPVSAQFSAGYKFLEAVKKKDGNVVNEMLGEPGTTVVNTRDVTTGETALHLVTNKRDLTWMTFLLAKGANPNARDVHGGTPLVAAANVGFVEGVQLLLDKGARVDDPNGAGETPLISAVHRKDVALMRVLLKAGADPDRADNSGRSARDYALLDGKNSNLVTEIVTNAKPRAARGAATRSYGPSL
ncbi:MAG: ankyrin repeat domain-containing protein [Sphingomonadales bacterium]|nr:ankyrin repeat domain-containing protein [Sphingomonadales bacterium]